MMTSDDSIPARRAAAWAANNAEAISERRRWIETNGTPLADVQSWTLENMSALTEEARHIKMRGIPGSDIAMDYPRPIE